MLPHWGFNMLGIANNGPIKRLLLELTRTTEGNGTSFNPMAKHDSRSKQFDYNVGLDMILSSYDYIYSNKLKRTWAIKVSSDRLILFDAGSFRRRRRGYHSPTPRWTLKKLTPPPTLNVEVDIAARWHPYERFRRGGRKQSIRALYGRVWRVGPMVGNPEVITSLEAFDVITKCPKIGVLDSYNRQSLKLIHYRSELQQIAIRQQLHCNWWLPRLPTSPAT